MATKRARKMQPRKHRKSGIAAWIEQLTALNYGQDYVLNGIESALTKARETNPHNTKENK